MLTVALRCLLRTDAAGQRLIDDGPIGVADRGSDWVMLYFVLRLLFGLLVV